MPGYKFDHAPLLPPGRHYRSIHDLEGLCVHPFDGQPRTCREKLFYALENFFQRLLVADVPCELIVDGSFLTEKPQPSDVDVKVYIDVDAHERLTPEQLIVFNSINDDIYIDKIDCTAYVVYPIGHECFRSSLDLRNNGEDYGLEHGQVWLKGYVVLLVGESDVGLRIRR